MFKIRKMTSVNSNDVNFEITAAKTKIKARLISVKKITYCRV